MRAMVYLHCWTQTRVPIQVQVYPFQQGCIPVGCVPPALVPLLVGVSGPVYTPIAQVHAGIHTPLLKCMLVYPSGQNAC